MTIEQELRDHFNRSAADLAEPEDRLGVVQQRGRRRRTAQGVVAAIAVVIAAVGVTTALRPLLQQRVEFGAPADQQGEQQSPDPATAVEVETATLGTIEVVAVGDLGAPVLVTAGRTVNLVNGNGVATVEQEQRFEGSLGDGRGGLVASAGSTLQWFTKSDGGGLRLEETLATGDGFLSLRTVVAGRPAAAMFGSPSPRALYSDAIDGENGEVTVRFYAVEVAQGATPEIVGEYTAHEGGVEGPTPAVNGFVHAGCHLACSLYRGVAEPEGEALYHGGGSPGGTTASIDGLTSTPSGDIIAFVESPPAAPADAENPLVLVLLDGATFKSLARIELPADPRAKQRWESGEGPVPPEVSISANGQRVLVSAWSNFIVEGARKASPRIKLVDGEGTLRWFDAEAANKR